ncbi:hypothetical protein ABBQ32_013825 [Trebouxia sp. C0010 RCD-2024]
MLAAQQQKEAAKETKRKKYVAIGPARQSKRAGAERTRARLQQQAQKSAESSEDEQSISSASQESQRADDSASKSGLSKLRQKRKRSTQEADFDPADMASSDSDAEVSEMSDDGAQQSDEDADAEDPELQHALAMSMAGQTGLKAGSQHGKSKHKAEPCITQASVADDCKIAAAKAPAPVKKGKVQKATRKPGKGKSAGRVGLINPTPEEIKTAFSMFNPHNKSVIDAQDIARVALEHGVNFDEDELNAMMEVAASITQRASTSNMTFQGFQKLIQNLSTVT